MNQLESKIADTLFKKIQDILENDSVSDLSEAIQNYSIFIDALNTKYDMIKTTRELGLD